MVSFLTPEELEAFSEAERAQIDSSEAKAKMLEQAKARNILRRLDRLREEEKLVPAQLPADLQEAAQIMDERELVRFYELHELEDRSCQILAYFCRIAVARTLTEERGGEIS